MQNKQKNWNDVETFISAAAIALTLGLWSYLAAPKKSGVDGSQTTASLVPAQPVANVVVSVTPAPMLQPGQVLLLGGVLPTPDAAVTAAPAPGYQPPVVVQSKGGGKSGGTVTKTHSSHP